MEAIKRPLGLTIERDIHFKEIPFNDLFHNKRLEELQEMKHSKEQENQQDQER